jgi:thiol-disulfide isomerase/thioredoxin
MTPIFDKVKAELENDDIIFQIVDVDNDESLLTQKYKVRNIPTVIITDEYGNEINKLVGLQTEDKLKEIILNS